MIKLRKIHILESIIAATLLDIKELWGEFEDPNNINLERITHAISKAQDEIVSTQARITQIYAT